MPTNDPEIYSMNASLTRPIPVDCTTPGARTSLRLLHVITSMDSKQGGPPEGIRQMSQPLSNDGHLIDVVCLDRENRTRTDDSCLKIHAVGPALGKYHYSPTFVPWLRENVGRFDCVIAHDIWQYPCLATWRTLRHSAIPYFVFTHGMLDPWFQRTYPLKHLKKVLYWRAAGHKVLRDAQGVVFTTEEERLLAGQSFRPYQCNGMTVGFGTTGAKGNASDLRRTFLDAFPALATKKIILYLGRVNSKKGVDLLIEAFSRTAAKDTGYQLVIAGPCDAAWRASLERLAAGLGVAKNVTWTGLLADEQKWGAFYASDVFCLPSHQENFALAVAEALSCGLPVLISNKVNIWREIDSARAGFVGNDDVAGTSQALESWLSVSDDQRAMMRRRASECFERSFKIDAVARIFVQALREHGVVSRSTPVRTSL
jgi:glycosyltransferase involved in cell wall biosynthesis